MNDIVLGMRFEVDGKEAVGQIRIARSELANLRQESQKNREESTKSAQAEEQLKAKTQAYVEALTKKVATLGLSRQGMLQYEAAQLRLTEAEQKAVVSMQQSIDAHERKEERMQGMIRTAGTLALAAGAAGIALAAMIKKESIQAAIESQQSHLRLEATLKATGHAAGLTKLELNALADEMSRTTSFDDEEIRNGISTMLKFKDISGETFKQAIKLSADYAAATGTDFTSATQAVARGLQDIESATRLAVAMGGRLNDSDIAQIKSLQELGRFSEAHAIILNKMAGASGGVAQAMNSGLLKAQNDSKKAWGELLEAIGETNVVGGRFERTAEALTNFMNGLTGAINGTDDTLTEFIAAIGLSNPALRQYVVLLDQVNRLFGGGKDTPSAGQGAGKNSALKNDLSAYLAQADKEEALRKKAYNDLESEGRRNDERDAKAAEAKKKLAESYGQVTKAAADYLTQLETQRDSVGATTAQKIMLTAAVKAMTLATTAERIAFLQSAAAIAQVTEANEDDAKAKKELEDARKKSIDTQAKELEALDKEIQKQKEHNYELVNGAGSYQEYQAAQLEAYITTQEFAGATEEDTAALRAKLKALRELAQLKSTGEAIEDTQKAADEFYKNMARQAQQYQGILTDAIEQALFDGGVKGSDVLKSLLRQVFRDLTSGNGGGISQSIASLFGGGGGTGSGGGLANGIGNLLSTWLGTQGAGTGGGSGSMLWANSGYGESAAGGAGGMGMGLAAIGGQLVGSFGSKAMGAGQRGQQVGGMTGAAGAMIGMQVFGPIGAVVGAVLGALAGKFTDPDGDADRRGKFGSAGAVNFTPGYSFKSRLGEYGIGETKWFSDDGGMPESIKKFLTTLQMVDDTIAASMTDAQTQAAKAKLQGRADYGFGMERTDVNNASAFPEIFKSRYGAVFDTIGEGLFGAGAGKLGDLMRNATGTIEQLAQVADAVLGMTNVSRDLDVVLEAIGSNGVPNLTASLDVLETQLAAAQTAFNESLKGRDPVAIMAAEQELQGLIVNKYQTEREWIEGLAQSLSQLKQQAYEFAVAMAGRINGVGGSRDIAGIAGGRAGDVRASLAGVTDPAKRVAAIQSYLSAVDTEYNARKQSILNDAQAQQAAAQSQASLQSSIAQARIAALQQELDLAGQWTGVLGEARQMIDQLKFSGASPLAASMRLAMSENETSSLFGQFRGASGADKIALAGRLLPGLQTRAGLLGQSAQRPSDQYLSGYNEIMAMLAEVEQYSQTESEKQTALQEAITQLQEQANAFSAQTADATQYAAAALAELNAQTLAQYEFAEKEGAEAYALQEKQHAELLQQITGGMEIDLYLAQLQTESRDALVAIKDAIHAFLGGVANGNGAAVTTNPTIGVPIVTPGNGGNGAGGGVTEFKIDLGPALGSFVLNTITGNATQLRRELARA